MVAPKWMYAPPHSGLTHGSKIMKTSLVAATASDGGAVGGTSRGVCVYVCMYVCIFLFYF